MTKVNTYVCTCCNLTVCYKMLLCYVLLLQSGWTALHFACYYGEIEIVNLLLKNNVDISVTNKVNDKLCKSDFTYILILCEVHTYVCTP